MITNITPELFLEHHIGQKFTAVSYDQNEWGRFGEDISVEPVSKGHTPNGYQSDIVSNAVAEQTYVKLEQSGFRLKEHFMKVEVPGIGYTFIFTPAGVEFARGNAAFLAATNDKPLMAKSGLLKVTSKDGHDSYPTAAATNATDKALTYLRALSAESGVSTAWHVDGRNFTLMGLTDETFDTVRQQLNERRIPYSVIPATTDMGDMDDHGPQIQVVASSLQMVLNSRDTGLALYRS